MWPAHCVQGSEGGAFHAALARAPGDVVVRKGAHELVDSYSGFGDANGGRDERTELEGELRARGTNGPSALDNEAELRRDGEGRRDLRRVQHERAAGATAGTRGPSIEGCGRHAGG